MQEELEADPRSARLARALAGDTLEAWGLDELVETAALLVSELVTNALLHAGSPLRLRIERLPSAVRVAVQDANETLPALYSHDPEAVTGRGLELVSLLADRTGSHRADSGKIVWFELAAPHDASLAESASVASPEAAEEAEAPEAQRAHVPVTLLDVPWRLLTATRQHTDALLRELAMIDLAEGVVTDAPFGSLAAALGLSEGLAEGEPDSAIAQRQPHEAVDEGAVVVVTVAADSGAVERLADRVQRADALAQGNATLVPPALPEVAACRQWFLTELSNQIAGYDPTPWSVAEAGMTERMEPSEVPGVAPEAVLDGMAEAVLLADSDNRIRYANPAVELLLGWEPEELVGRRVLEIVPGRFHAAHIAGYTRYLVTSEPRLIGTPVEVPVQCRDGSETTAVMLLSALDGPEADPLFVATFRAPADRLDLSAGSVPE